MRNHGGTALHATVAPTADATRPDPEQGADELLDFILAVLGDEKAEDVTCIVLRGKSPLADHMVIASARSARHVRAVAEGLAERLKKERGVASSIEGLEVCDWVLIDAGDAIVHVFRPEVRSFYDLEKLWQGAAPQPATAAG